jgi:hypothetical protein
MVLGFRVPPPPKFGAAPRHRFTSLARLAEPGKLMQERANRFRNGKRPLFVHFNGST